MTVIVTLRNGDQHSIRGSVDAITADINNGRMNNLLIQLERDTVPTGEKISIDPHEVISVKDAR